jgi:hypothetical protein
MTGASSAAATPLPVKKTTVASASPQPQTAPASGH